MYTVSCKALKTLQREYHENEAAKIILQPMGVKGRHSGEILKVQYDVLKSEFQPASCTHTYSSEDLNFISDHIKRFRLNDSKYRTCKLQEYVKNVVDNYGKLPVYEYNNLVVEIFAEKLKGKSENEVLKICKMIYVAGFLTA